MGAVAELAAVFGVTWSDDYEVEDDDDIVESLEDIFDEEDVGGKKHIPFMCPKCGSETDGVNFDDTYGTLRCRNRKCQYEFLTDEKGIPI